MELEEALLLGYLALGLNKMHTALQENNYILIKNFIDKNEAEKLAQNFMADCENFEPDHQSPNAPSKYNYEHFLYLLCEKTGKVSSIYGNKVIPTYAYARWYRNGGTLAKHSDRESCEVSITLNLKKDRDWPIYIETPYGQTASVELDQGDAMMYLGSYAKHWRDEITDGNIVQVFLHYVDINGPNKGHYFDRIVVKDSDLE